ncbi:IclR family transcriptional regulator [Paenibacillus sp. GCM10023252]|uniref:IclR family transcriptional regulator n=1 Tax=Paenibacillus sp. GCM10023252 TaxID=3252649 RepID=UPI00361A9EF5
MDRKYWVPALERANLVVQAIAAEPSKLRLIDLTAATGINKSTMFSLLHTMETLGWVNREKGDTYSLGAAFAYLGNAYFSGINLVELFMQKSGAAVERLGETVQMAKLDGSHIIYLAKKEAPSQVRLLSEPGMRLPAYSTAMGKMLLSHLEDAEVILLHKEVSFKSYTDRTVASAEELLAQLAVIRKQGFSTDEEEFAPGFSCIAAPILNRSGAAVAAVSFTLPSQQWETKRETAAREIQRLAGEIGAAL